MKKIILFLIFTASIVPNQLDAGAVSTGKFYNYGKVSVSGIPGLYGDFQLNFGNVIHFGSGYGYKPVARELYNTGATTVVFDAYLMYHFLKIGDGELYANIGVLGGIFIDDVKTGPQFGITSEIFYKEDFSLRLNPVYGPRAGIEFVYHYNSDLNFTLGITGISGVVGLELNL